jgi:pimeloyl-ACP methyl ester carboxylesterase
VRRLLAGTSATGRDYVEVGYELASHGFIAVMSDSPINQFALQVLDGIALHAALVDENENRSSFLYQQLQTQRIALMGHSRGGAHVAHVLAQNPGYVCGVAYAPYRGPQLEYTKAYAPLVDVPMLVLGGRGDQISTAEDHVRGFFHELSGIRELKTLHIFDSNCTHYNIAAYLTWQQQMDKEIFDAVHRGVRAWLRAWIEEEPLFLDGVVGDSARGEGHISELSFDQRATASLDQGADPHRSRCRLPALLGTRLRHLVVQQQPAALPAPDAVGWSGTPPSVVDAALRRPHDSDRLHQRHDPAAQCAVAQPLRPPAASARTGPRWLSPEQRLRARADQLTRRPCKRTCAFKRTRRYASTATIT